MKTLIVFLCLIAGICRALPDTSRPNILWITFEDTSWNQLGCYGNAEALTPRIDALAKEGLRFTHAYSNAPVCAVARSTILNGAYAVTQGTQHMRSRHPIPEAFKSYVSHLREAGYYCTNQSKTDYNFKGVDTALWDDSSREAHYRNRPAGKPFFAVINLLVTHESSLFPEKISKNRAEGIIPKEPRLDPAKVFVPPYLPDLPEIRSDIAIFQDGITALDRQVGKLLDELAAEGLTGETIVFFYSDHGGILPRGKRYLEDTGVRVPMVVSLPEKWRSLSPFGPHGTVDEPVSFVDLAPTLLSLIGLEKPAPMQGRAFLGRKRVEPAKDDVVFLYADRFDEINGMRRGITDGRWKYIRCFTPHLPAAPYSHYPFGQAGWAAWQKAWKDGKLDPQFSRIWERPQPVELLFDTTNDPWEIHNLASDPAHAERLATLRGRLRAKMIEVADTGLIPEPMFAELAPGKPVATWLAGHKAEIPALVDLAFAASDGNAKNLDRFLPLLAGNDPVSRYWAAQGCLILGKSAAPASDALADLLDDPHSAIRVSAALALAASGKRDQGESALLNEFQRAVDEKSQQNAAHALTHINAQNKIPDQWIESTLQNTGSGEYAKRLATRLKLERN